MDEALESLYVCMYCTGFCMQLKALCTRLPIISVHPRTIVLVHGVLEVRSYVLLTKYG